MIGLNVGVSPVSAIYRGAAQLWQWPAELAFGPADKGLLLDPSRLDLLDQLAAGGSPVTAPGQPVGFARRMAGTVDAAQAVSAARPTLGRHPKTGRRNLLTRSETLSHGVWTKQSSTVLSEMQVRDIPTSSSHLLRRVTNSMAAGTYTVSFECKAVGPVIACTLLVAYSVGTGSWHINLQTGVATQSATVIPSNCVVTSAGDGWFRVVFTFMAAEPVSYWDIRFSEVWPVPTSSGRTYLGDGTGGMDFRGGFQMETGNTATPYQRVETDLDVTEAGVPEAWYLSLDGIDDFLSTTAIAWGSDEVTVIAGFARLSSSLGVLVELSANSNNAPGSWRMTAPDSAPSYVSAARGSEPMVGGNAASRAFTATPETVVLSATHKIGTSTSTIRVNGVAGSPGLANKGNGNFGTYGLFIGNRGGSLLPVSGRLYGLLAINRILNPTELSMAERYLGNKCGVTLP